MSISSSLKPNDMIPSGITLLNLAGSDSLYGAFPLGKTINIIGDSSSGKTMLCLTILAEMCTRKRFDAHTLIYDDVECALEMNIPYLFGESLNNRLLPPNYDKDKEPNYSNSIEELYVNIMSFVNKGIPFIYVIDSLDALTSMEDHEQTQKLIKQIRTGKTSTGSYQMAKPKLLSKMLRVLKKKIDQTNSFVIVVSQTRDNIGGFSSRTRAGGRALKFYCAYEIWLSHIKQIKQSDRVIGNETRLIITKNKITGKVRDIQFCIYYDYGIDDIKANVHFLIENKVWEIKDKTIHAPTLGIEGTINKIIKHIESNNLEKQVRIETSQAWNAIENSLKLHRKNKY